MNKTCKTCKEILSIEAFQKRSGYKDGYRPHCTKCRRIYENANFHKNKHKRPYNYEYDKNQKLKAAYGIGYAEYKNMLAAQNDCCAICGTDSTGVRKAFHVDHCHTTGVVRGLLCGNCNSGIGNLRDDVDLLKRAIIYLESTLG